MATVTPGKVFASNEIVTPTNLNALGVPTVTLANSEVTTAKIADANVTTAKIADANVTTAKIADGAVTHSKLNSSVILVPTGAVMPFAMNTAPSGWLEANGAEHSKTGTYATLFSVIGTTYGETNGANGIGTTHFRVPDLRGIFVRGINSQSISGVTYSGTLGTKQNDTFKNHNHVIAADVSVNTSAEIIAGQYLAAKNTSFNDRYILAGTATVPTLGLTGSTGDAETRPANIALLYCIKI
jgi:microcystin-dependent protein